MRRESLFRVLRESTKPGEPLDLILYTRGDTNAVWPVVGLLREYDEDFEVTSKLLPSFDTATNSGADWSPSSSALGSAPHVVRGDRSDLSRHLLRKLGSLLPPEGELLARGPSELKFLGTAVFAG